MGEHMGVQHIREDNLVTDHAGLKIKRPGWSFQYCERPHGGCWAITCILTFCLPATTWRQWGPLSVLLRSENLNIAIHLFACGCFSPDMGGNVNIPESDEMYYYRNPHQETLGVNSVMSTECFQVPTLKCYSSLVYSWKDLMSAYVQWK